MSIKAAAHRLSEAAFPPVYAQTTELYPAVAIQGKYKLILQGEGFANEGKKKGRGNRESG
jgi:hypothetical protein